MSPQQSVQRYTLLHSQGLVPITSSDTYNLNTPKLIEIVDNKSIAGIAMIAPGTTEVIVIHHPICHRNDMGDVTHIIGNPSDKQDEFGLIKIDLASIRLVLCVGEDTTIPPFITPGEKIDPAHLLGTKFQGKTNIVGAAVSNITVLPFQSANPTGIDILDEDQMNSLKSSPNYQWLNIAKSYIDNQDEIELIVTKVLQGDEALNRTKYFESNQVDPNVPSWQLAVNGIHCTTTSTSSDAYPVEAAQLRAFYTGSSPPPQVNSSTDSLVRALTQVISPDEMGDKEKAKMGVAKLSLFAIKASINFSAKTVTHLSLAALAKGFGYVISMSLKNQSDALVQLHDKQCQNGREINTMHVMSNAIKNIHLEKSSAIRILAGDLSVESLADMMLHNPLSESITAAFFLQARTTEISNLVATTQKQTYVKSMIARVAAMKNLDDIKTLLVHIMIFLGVIVDEVDKTFLHQVMERLLVLIHKPTFLDWYDKNGTDFVFLAFRAVEQIVVHVAKHASDLYNVNSIMMAQSNVPPVFDDNHLIDALSVLKTFELNVDNAMANETELLSQSNVALAYKAMADQAAKDATPAPKADAPESKPTASSSNEGSKQRKKNPSAGDSKVNNKRMKPFVVDTTRAPRKTAIDLGLFKPNAGVSKNKIMPPSFMINGKEVCVDFASVGLVCAAPSGTCTRIHVAKPADLGGTDNINMIAKHFMDNGIGTFNPGPFRNVTLPDDLKSVISG